MAVALGLVTAAAMAVGHAGRSAAATTTTAKIDASCTPSGTPVATGSSIISGPMVPAITSSTLELSLPTTVQRTTEINPGGTIVTTAQITLDLGAVAADILANRVKPAVGAAGYPQLEDSAFATISLSDTSIALALPAGVTPLGTPSTSASAGVNTQARFGPGTVQVAIGDLSADTRTSTSPVTVTLSWSSTDDGAPPPRTLALTAGTITFDAHIDVGVVFYGSPIIGGVSAPWACTPPAPAAVLGSTQVVSTPVTTSAPTTTLAAPSTSSLPGSSVAPATTAPSTTWPSATTTPPIACVALPLDVYGGAMTVKRAATGFFRTARIDGRWWFIDPDGHPFFSQGINHVSFEGTPDKNGNTAYEDAVTARYGTPQAWAAAEESRLKSWGYNTLGAWSDVGTFDDTMPFTLLLNLTSQNFSTGVMEDLWDPSWQNDVQSTINAAAAHYRNDPMLVGYWSDNELHWGPDWRPAHLFDEYLARPASAPGKYEMLTWLESRYGSFAAFTADFTTTAHSWADLSASSTVTSWTPTGGQATRNAWVGHVAQRYFSVIATDLHAADPHHLFLGPRMIAQTTGTPVLEAASRYVDVAGFNDYSIVPELAGPLANADPTYLPVADSLAAQEAILNKPILVSEWGYRAADSGLPNTWPPLFPVLQSQQQRAAAYEKFVSGLLSTDWVVGQHFFEFADEPAAGRADGENSNFGLVDENDDPYAPVVDISRTMHDCAYARLAADVGNPPPTIGTTTTSAASTSGPIGSLTASTTVPERSARTEIGGHAPWPRAVEQAPPATPARARPRYTG